MKFESQLIALLLNDCDQKQDLGKDNSGKDERS